MSVNTTTRYHRPVQDVNKRRQEISPNRVGNTFGDRRLQTNLKNAQATQTVQNAPPTTIRRVVDWFLGARKPKNLDDFRGSDQYIGTPQKHPLKTIEEGPLYTDEAKIQYLEYLDAIIATK